MTSFADRERAFEAKFASDEHAEFRAQARRDRQLALWAGEQLGLSGEALENYVLEVWRADLQHPGDSDVAEKVRADLQKGGVSISAPELEARMHQLLLEARRDVYEGR
jgi:hypothetical protein